MTPNTKLIAAGFVSLLVVAYLFWHFSPYEQCVRAETEMQFERLKELRDEQDRILPGEYQGDDEIWNEQNRRAKIGCYQISN